MITDHPLCLLSYDGLKSPKLVRFFERRQGVCLALSVGFDPTTHRLTGDCSTGLSYDNMAGWLRLEHRLMVLETIVLPITPPPHVASPQGFEPWLPIRKNGLAIRRIKPLCHDDMAQRVRLELTVVLPINGFQDRLLAN